MRGHGTARRVLLLALLRARRCGGHYQALFCWCGRARRGRVEGWKQHGVAGFGAAMTVRKSRMRPGLGTNEPLSPALSLAAVEWKGEGSPPPSAAGTVSRLVSSRARLGRSLPAGVGVGVNSALRRGVGVGTRCVAVPYPHMDSHGSVCHVVKLSTALAARHPPSQRPTSLARACRAPA